MWLLRAPKCQTPCPLAPNTYQQTRPLKMLVQVLRRQCRPPLARRPILSLLRPISLSSTRRATSPSPPPPNEPSTGAQTTTIRENIYTLPNLLTMSRILACPVLGWAVIDGNFTLATSLLAYAGITDLVSWSACKIRRANTNRLTQVDGFIARRYNQQTVLGTILDPAADKMLMTTLTVTLAMKGLLPGTSRRTRSQSRAFNSKST